MVELKEVHIKESRLIKKYFIMVELKEVHVKESRLIEEISDQRSSCQRVGTHIDTNVNHYK